QTVPQQLFVEGESATLTAPMAEQQDANASGGSYIMVPAAGVGGKAVFTVMIPADGDYYVWGRVLAPTDANNSFHFSVDADTVDNAASDGTSTIWDLTITTTFAFNKLNMRIDAAGTDQNITTHLTAGSHTIYLNQREDQTGLDRFIFSSDPNFVPN